MGKNKSPNENRSNTKNPNNPAYKAARDNRANQLNQNIPRYQSKSRNYEDVTYLGKNKMTSKAARRIQSHADRTGRNLDFKVRVQRAAAKNKRKN